jgi:localization factor PodJL
MSKANANSADDAGGRAANGSGGPGLSPIENWLQRAMADLARRGADDESPIDLTESLAAMAALLQETVRPRNGARAAAQGRGDNGASMAGARPPAADIAAPAGAGGVGEPADASLADLPRLLDRIEARWRAGGDESLRPALTDLEAGLGWRAARAGTADASASAPDPGGEATGPARAPTLETGEAVVNVRDAGSLDALTNLVESTRLRLIETFETGLAAAAIETRALKGMVQTLAERIEVPRETAARDRAIKALERDIAMIAGHLARADKGFAALAALEQSIGRLFEQMEQTRRTAPDAAEAARRLGTDTHERRMTREVAELRAARDEADNRIHLALSAVQETVSKVDDRLARMEADPGAMRPTRATPAGTMASSPGRRPRKNPANGAAARGPLEADALAIPSPGPAMARKNPPSSEHDAAAVAPGAEIDDFLIEPGAGFPPRAPKRRLPAPPLSAQDAGHEGQGEKGRGEKGLGQPDLVASARRARAAGKGREPARRGGGAGGFFNAFRKPIILGVAALSLALGAYALATRNGALRSFDPAGLLKAIGIGAAGEAAPVERRSVIAGGAPGSPARRPEPGNPPRVNSGLLDPAAFESARKNPSVVGAAPGKGDRALRAIAGSAPVVPGKITVRAPAAKTPPNPPPWRVL